MSQDERWKQVEIIFNQAVSLSPDERDFFLKQNCGDDAELYDEVVSLISSDNESGNDGLEQSVFPLIAELLEDEFGRLLNNPVFASYELEWLLGRGGMGAVFLAVDKRLDRSVAIKVLPSSITENSRAALRFEQEAKAASAISHQNIAHIYEYGNYEGMYFLAMEYVAGKTLRERLKDQQIDLALAINVALQTCQALKAAHKKNIVHRDIKPENIMVSEENLVKVVDFGIAKVGEKGKENGNKTLESTPGLLIGTVNYMSPEQLRRDAVDERTDLWSLGVVLYEMLAGKRPFDGETPSDTQADILLKEPPPLEIAKKIPRLGKIIAKALAKNVAARYQTAEELLTDLQFAQRDVYDYARQNEKKALNAASVVKSCPKCFESAAASASSCGNCGFRFTKRRQIVGKQKRLVLKPARSKTAYFVLSCAAAVFLGGYIYVNQSSENRQNSLPTNAALGTDNRGNSIDNSIDGESKIIENSDGKAAHKVEAKLGSKINSSPKTKAAAEETIMKTNGDAPPISDAPPAAAVETQPDAKSEPTPTVNAKPTPQPEAATPVSNNKVEPQTEKSSGAVYRCADGSISYSKNRVGACSGHGGIAQAPDASNSSATKNETKGRTYVRGPRGGCYYLNDNGKKTYVDVSRCN
jgi:serine/threonine protein kinase